MKKNVQWLVIFVFAPFVADRITGRTGADGESEDVSSKSGGIFERDESEQ